MPFDLADNAACKSAAWPIGYGKLRLMFGSRSLAFWIRQANADICFGSYCSSSLTLWIGQVDTIACSWDHSHWIGLLDADISSRFHAGRFSVYAWVGDYYYYYYYSSRRVQLCATCCLSLQHGW